MNEAGFWAATSPDAYPQGWPSLLEMLIRTFTDTLLLSPSRDFR